MSGFAAIFNREGGPVQMDHLAALDEGVAHRGPDGRNAWRNGPVGLVHSHFWTTPEEAGERQPVQRGDRLWISADLRLDNRGELCAELGGAVDERTATDAEIVLAAYDRWAEDCPRHLVGDFAFALWDAPRRRLFLARDPLGVRPLYYALDHHRLIAASTLEAVLGTLDTPAEVHEPFLRDLLALRFERWIAETPYRGVLRLPPAHRMTVEAGQAVVSRYWTFGEALPPPLRRDEEEVERFREVFLTAVKAQLRSTGPAGFLVSGGLDSSTVCCAAQLLAETGALPWHNGLRFYSCVFEETPAAEEREYAEAVARRCTRAHTTFVPSDDSWGLRDFGHDSGYPLAEPEVNVNRALLMRPLRAARADGCKAVLTGLGGDEVLGGQHYHTPLLLRDVAWSRLAAEIPHFLRWSRCSAAGLLFDAWVRPAVPPPLRRLARRLLGREAAATADRRPATHLRSWSARASYRMLTSGSFAAVMSSFDVAAAGVGVETRHPFLDRRLIEVLCHLPARLLFGGGWTKLVLRQSGLLPEEVRRRTRPAHFGELVHRGLRHEMRWKVRELLQGSRVVAAGLLAEAAPLRLWEDYWRDADAPGPRDALIGFLCTETWLRGQELRATLPTDAPPRVPVEAVKR
ncbi:MAG TPA: asparagine synthase-related protein [Thermoanaerobaculia bacterium]|nr:asparagine synthase-related protein [Thermoanaerobaculia bacterium]